MVPRKRALNPQPKNPLAAKVVTLEREVTRLKARAERAVALDGCARAPTQLVFNLAGIKGVAPVITGPVRH